MPIRRHAVIAQLVKYKQRPEQLAARGANGRKLFLAAVEAHLPEEEKKGLICGAYEAAVDQLQPAAAAVPAGDRNWLTTLNCAKSRHCSGYTQPQLTT